MRIQAAVKTLALALPIAIAVNGCILIPEVEDRIVELAVGHSIVVPLNASGEINAHDDASTVDLDGQFDLADILDDNGLSADDVKDVKLAGVSYRITRAEAGRTITGGTVEFDTSPTPPGAEPTGAPPTAGFTNLITNFNADASATTDWITVTLDPAGVTAINSLLGAILTDLKNGTNTADRYVTYHVYGTSNPGADATDFDYEIKLNLTIVGTFETDVVN